MRFAGAALVAAVLAVVAAMQIRASATGPSASRAIAASTSCENLRSLALPHARVDSAETAGRGPGAGRGPATNMYGDVPAFCRVRATLTPSTDSDIKAEVWLPASNWNGKYEAVGGGGWAGAISYAAMAAAVRAGYATSSTDTGHTGATADFSLGHPEKLIDFGYRAVHETTAFAKPVVQAFYAAAPKTSFFNGCSTGGRQAITEAQHYPNDFDAIVAGASAWDGMRLHALRVAISQRINRNADGDRKSVV